MRVATLDDHEIVFNLAFEFFNNSPYKNDLIDEGKVDQLVTNFLSAPKTDAIVLLSGDTGVLVGAAAEKLYSFDRFASEVIFWITPKARGGKTALRLITAYEYWAENVAKVTNIQMVGLGDMTHNLYSRLGYTQVERTYVKDI